MRSPFFIFRTMYNNSSFLLKSLKAGSLLATALLSLGGCAMNQGAEQALREINAKMDATRQEQIAQARTLESVHSALRNQAQMAADFGRLQDSVMVLGGQIEELNARTQMLGQKMERSRDNSDTGASGDAGTQAEIRAVNLRLEKLNERIKTLSTKLSVVLGEPVEEERQSGIPSAAEATASATSRPNGPTAVWGEAPAVPMDRPGTQERQVATEGELYQRAYSAFLSGKYDEAVAGFEEYLKMYPNTELSDNAIFWLGESQMGAGQMESAVATFDMAAQSFPNSNKAPTALLRGAEILLKLERQAQAQEKLRQVMERYPTAHEAATARNRLEEISR